MGCILTLIALITPRFCMALIFIFTGWFGAAFETTIWPLLGFLFLPYTTLAYMAAMLHNDHSVSGFWIALLLIAFIADLSADGGAVHKKTKPKKPKTPDEPRENEPGIMV